VRLLGALLAALVLAGTAGAGPGNGPILFSASPDGSNGPSDLFSIHADGSQRTRVTTAFHPVKPVMSPDGTKVAFYLTDGGSPRDLYVMNSDGTAARLLRSYPEYENSGTGLRALTWSPDSTKVAFLLPQLVSDEQLRIVDVSTGADVPFAADGSRKSSLAWSPDGSELAFVLIDAGGRPSGIAVKSLAAGAVRTLVSGDALYPRWSPDGRSLAFIKQIGGVWIVPRDGGAPTEIGKPIITPPLTEHAPPLWSPDGRAIYFSQAVSVGPPYVFGIPTTYRALFVAHADGSGQTRLRSSVEPIGWSPEGDALVVSGDGVAFMQPDGKCLTFVAAGSFVGWRPGGNPPAPFECVDLTVEASAPAVAGRVGVPYSIAVANEGTLPARATLTQEFDSIVSLVSYDKRGCTFKERTLTCALGTVAPNERRTFKVTARSDWGALGSTISVSTSARDSNPTSNTATTQTRIDRCWLLGTEGPDTLRGTKRSELICGLGGDDRIFTGGGHDTIEAGRGNDEIFARDGQRDVIRCGPGDDRVIADRIDRVARDCEHVTRG